MTEGMRLRRRARSVEFSKLLLTKAKVEAPARDSLDERLRSLRRSTKGRPSTGDVPEEVSMLFHPETLRQLCALREDLDVESSREDCFLAACITGILHGSSRGYLSLSMPNTFSMSPNYIRRYVADHGLKPPRRNVFEALASKISRLYGDGRPIGDGRVHRLDGQQAHAPRYTSMTRGSFWTMGQFRVWPRTAFSSPPPREILNYQIGIRTI